MTSSTRTATVRHALDNLRNFHPDSAYVTVSGHLGNLDALTLDGSAHIVRMLGRDDVELWADDLDPDTPVPAELARLAWALTGAAHISELPGADICTDTTYELTVEPATGQQGSISPTQLRPGDVLVDLLEDYLDGSMTGTCDVEGVDLAGTHATVFLAGGGQQVFEGRARVTVFRP